MPSQGETVREPALAVVGADAAVPGPLVTVLATEDIIELVVLAALGFVVGLYFIYEGAQKYRKYALVRNTATERVRSIAVGRTELEGVARSAWETVDRPFSPGECLYAQWEIEEYRSTGRSDAWQRIGAGSYGVPFYLEDDTGRVLVADPSDATATLSDEHTRQRTVDGGRTPNARTQHFCRQQGIAPESSNERRYSQGVLPPETRTYVLGQATELEEARGRDNEDRIQIERDESSDRFIISDRSEDQLVSHYRTRSLLKVFGGLALSGACLWGWLTLAPILGWNASLLVSGIGIVVVGLLYEVFAIKILSW